MISDHTFTLSRPVKKTKKIKNSFLKKRALVGRRRFVLNLGKIIKCDSIRWEQFCRRCRIEERKLGISGRRQHFRLNI